MIINKDLQDKLALTEAQVTELNAYSSEFINNEINVKLSESNTNFINSVNTNLGLEITNENFDENLKIYKAKIEKEQADLKKEFTEKIKNLSTDDIKIELDLYKKQVAELEKDKGYKTKFEELQKELTTKQTQLAFNSSIPDGLDFPNDKVKKIIIDSLKNNILDKYTIIEEEGVFKVVDKNNQYKIFNLIDVIKNDEVLKVYQKDTPAGFKQPDGNKIKIPDLDLEINEEATPKERTQAIREFLIKKGISVTSSLYESEFSQLNKKILDALKK